MNLFKFQTKKMRLFSFPNYMYSKKRQLLLKKNFVEKLLLIACKFFYLFFSISQIEKINKEKRKNY